MNDFDGVSFDPLYDAERLSKQLGRVWEVTSDSKWRTLAEIQREASRLVPGSHDSEAAISARLRDLRKPKFGGYLVERRRRGAPSAGLWEYRVLVSAGT